MADAMEQAIYLSMATASISFAVTELKLFAPLREWARKKGDWLGAVIHCGYCFGHWVALALVFMFRPTLFGTWWLLDYLLATLAVAWLAAFQWLLMSWLFGLRGE